MKMAGIADSLVSCVETSVMETWIILDLSQIKDHWAATSRTPVCELDRIMYRLYRMAFDLIQKEAELILFPAFVHRC